MSTRTPEEYAKIIAYREFDSIDRDYLAEAFGSKQAVGGMISNLRNNPEVYTRLVEAGYRVEDIPEWVTRPSGEERVGGQDSAVTIPTP